MLRIGYYILLPFLYIISLLPFSVLYHLSDFLNLIVFKCLGYRKKIIDQNLKNAFPEKEEVEIQQIKKQFYEFFCDLIVETIKTLTISPSALIQRVSFEDNGIFEHYYKQKQSVVVVMGHLGNWELGGARFSQEAFHQLYIIYHPMSMKLFDQLVYKMRTRLGNKLYAMNDTFKGMVKNKAKLTATAFIADQTPPPNNAYWTAFLNQDTPIFRGTAKISKKFNYPIIYISITRPRRGFYAIKSELLIETPDSLTENEISELHTRRLEKDVQQHPSIWFWVHRRWKHKKNELVNVYL